MPAVQQEDRSQGEEISRKTFSFYFMEITRLVLGPLATNTYCLKIDNSVIIIDPAGRLDKMLPYLDQCNFLAILLTHGHFDHIRGVDSLYKAYHVPIYLNAADFDIATDPEEYRQNMIHFGFSASISSPILECQEGEHQIGPFKFTVYLTPGHTPGSVLYRFGNDLFTGDTLFKGSVGRTDLHTGNANMLKDSLRFIKTLDPELIIHPGHDEESTLAYEFANNPYLRP